MKYAASFSKGLLIIVVFVVATGCGQFVQLMMTQNDVRSSAMNDWAAGDEDRLLQVEGFTAECIKGGPSAENESVEDIKPVMTLEECAEIRGYEGIFAVVQQADRKIASYAWPLSMVAD